MGSDERLNCIFICPTTTQPRYHRRAESLLKAGWNVTVYAFDRGLYTANTFPQGVEVRSLGSVSDGQYLSRLPELFRAAKRIRKDNACKKTRLLYAFGADCSIIAKFAKIDAPLIYETGDVRYDVGGRSPSAIVGTFLDKIILKRASLIAVTSPAFVKQHYAVLDTSVENSFFLVENKLSPRILSYPRPTHPREPHSPIKIGIVGLLRYPRTMLAIAEAVAAKPGEFELHVYGEGPLTGDFQSWAEKVDNIFHYGPFKSPEDLPRIYDSIDLNYVVYDSTSKNVRMALPNKLYESMYFGVPMAVEKRTHLWERLEQFGGGFGVDSSVEGFASAFLDGLSPERLTRASAAGLAVRESMLVENETDIVDALVRIGYRPRS